LLGGALTVADRFLTACRSRSADRAPSGSAGRSLCKPQQEATMRLGIHVFADEREAVEALLAEGFVPVGREGTRHYRHPDRDADRWVRRADVRQPAKGGQNKAQVRVWRAFA
jgi:hypothetical protein